MGRKVDIYDTTLRDGCQAEDISLTLEDKSGTKISGLRYDSSEPLEQKLGEFPFHLGEGGSLSAFWTASSPSAAPTGS